MEVFEETERLGGKSVFFPCEAVEPIKMPNRFEGIFDADFDSLFFRFPDISSRAVPESGQQVGLVASEFQYVVQKLLGGSSVFKDDIPAPKFDGFPSGCFAIFRDRLHHRGNRNPSIYQRIAIIGKRKGNTSLPRKGIFQLHQWYGDASHIGFRENITRYVPVGVAKYPGPRGGVENTASIPRGDPPIPV